VPKHYPEGRQLQALERNVLKYRAFEMIIFLSHTEDLKRFVLETIRATNPARIPSGTKRPVEKAFAFFVQDGILTKHESADIQGLIDFRNVIGHRVHELTADVSRDPIAEDFVEYLGSKYQLSALRKIIGYEQVILERARSKCIVPLSLDHLVFEAAERVYRRELTRLAKTIRRQNEIRRQQISELNREIQSIDSYILDQVGPYHPLNIARNGALTKRGNDVCFRLFDLKLSDLSVAYLMRISLRAIRVRRRLWIAALPALP
jgi:hypothetical protein